MPTKTYRPRMAAELQLTAIGNPKERTLAEKSRRVYSLPFQVAAATLTRNDHNQADTISLTLDWQSTVLYPRLVRNATVKFWAGTADENGTWEPTSSGGRSGCGNLRFVGTVTEINRVTEEVSAFEVTLQATDHTEFFLRAKPFGTDGIPSMSMTLQDAWRCIVAQTPGAEKLADALKFYGVDPTRSLAELVPDRFANLKKVPTEMETDAWSAWQSVMDMTALISFVHLDKVIVTDADHYYVADASELPVFAWGENVLSIHERRNLVDFSDGIGARCFDESRGAMIEAVYPPRSKQKRKMLGVAKQASSDPEARIVTKYTWYYPQGSMNQVDLQVFAKRAYLERSKQEFQGILTTADFMIPTVLGGEVAFLDLAPGDNITVSGQASPSDAMLSKTVPERIESLMEFGYDADAAEIIAYSIDDPGLRDRQFYVKGYTFTCSNSPDSGEINFELQYCNRILVDPSDMDT